MKLATVILIGTFMQGLALEPLNPRETLAAKSQITPIALHSDSTTMLVFPSPVNMIVGAGLTDGAVPDAVQFDHRKGSNIVTLRPLRANVEVFCQILSGDKVFFLRLKSSEQPDSVVTIGVAQDAIGEAVGTSEVIHGRLNVPADRMARLVELARSPNTLRTVNPAEYAGSQTAEVSVTKLIGFAEARLERVWRFPKEDAFILLGTVTNRGKQPLVLDRQSFKILVGGVRQFAPNHLVLAGELAPGKEVKFEALVVGDGRGNRIHFSIKNSFAVEVSAYP